MNLISIRSAIQWVLIRAMTIAAFSGSVSAAGESQCKVLVPGAIMRCACPTTKVECDDGKVGYVMTKELMDAIGLKKEGELSAGMAFPATLKVYDTDENIGAGNPQVSVDRDGCQWETVKDEVESLVQQLGGSSAGGGTSSVRIYNISRDPNSGCSMQKASGLPAQVCSGWAVCGGTRQYISCEASKLDACPPADQCLKKTLAGNPSKLKPSESFTASEASDFSREKSPHFPQAVLSAGTKLMSSSGKGVCTFELDLKTELAVGGCLATECSSARKCVEDPCVNLAKDGPKSISPYPSMGGSSGAAGNGSSSGSGR